MVACETPECQRVARFTLEDQRGEHRYCERHTKRAWGDASRWIEYIRSMGPCPLGEHCTCEGNCYHRTTAKGEPPRWEYCEHFKDWVKGKRPQLII